MVSSGLFEPEKNNITYNVGFHYMYMNSVRCQELVSTFSRSSSALKTKKIRQKIRCVLFRPEKFGVFCEYLD